MKHKGNQSRRERQSRWGDINRKQEEDKLKEKKYKKGEKKKRWGYKIIEQEMRDRIFIPK